MYKYKTIIFDLDGTLFKSDELFKESFNTVRKQMGYESVSESAIKKHIGKPMADLCKEFFGELSFEEVEDIREKVRQEDRKNILRLGSLYKGVREMLNNLREEGFTLCICSYGSREYVDIVLECFGLQGYFSIVKSRVEGLNKSQLIKQILEETMSSSAIVVGDTVFDTEGADDAKCLSIGVTYGYGKDIDSDFTANYPYEIPILVNKINNFYSRLAEQIVTKKKMGLPLIVGINGVDTSGKTQLSKELYGYLNKQGYLVELVHIDDFHNPKAVRYQDPNPIKSYINNAFDLEKLAREVLYPIREQGKLETSIKCLDLESDKYINERSYSVNKDTIILVEGVLLYREPIDKYFDLRIFLEVTYDEVIKRAIKRDAGILGNSVVEKYREKYIPIQKHYISEATPTLKSDIVIDNLDFKNPKFLKLPTHNKGDKSTKIKLKPMGKKYLKDAIGVLGDHEAKEMLGAIYKPTLSNFKGKTTRSYAILSEAGEFLGIVEFFNISWKNRRAEYSIALQPLARGKGFGCLATDKILEIAFKELGLNRVWLRVLETNGKAIKLYERLGFVREGLCREESLRNGKFVSQIQMSILKKEWRKSY